MPYFDKKEDVLDIKLTPYGRHLLSRGKLMPKYYAFLDDDVLYDTMHMDFTGSNSEIKQRIIDDTPSLRPLYTMNSVETELSDSPQFNEQGEKIWIYSNTQIRQDAYANIYDNNYRPIGDINTKFLQNTLGTSKHGVDNAPRWDVAFIRGEIETTSTYNYTSSIPSTSNVPMAASILHIPQVKCDIEYTIQVKNETEDPLDISADQEPPEVYQGNYLDVIEEQAIMRILEKNGFIHNESFEIEVFEIKSDETLRQLKFLNKNNAVSKYKIDRDILIENSTQPSLEADMDTVEYYFDLRVDEEIPILDICEGLNELGSEGIFIQDLEIECPDLGPGEPDDPTGPSGPIDPCLEVECD